MGIGTVLKGGLWLYVGSILFSFLGLFYWVIASFYINPSIVGTAAAILSFEVLIITIISLGVPRGIQRFFGNSWGNGRLEELSTYLSAGLFYLCIVCIPVVAFFYVFPEMTLGIIGLNTTMILFLCILILLDFWAPLFYSLFKSVMKAETAAYADISLSIVKLVIGFVLLSNGYGIVGVLSSFVVGSLARDLLLLYKANKLFKKNQLKRFRQPTLPIVKKVIHAGTANWLPNTLLVIGQAIGVLFLYGAVSDYETGLYFLAFSISMIVYNLPDSIFGLMFPYLSGLSKNRDKATSWALRISLAATVTPSLILFVYSSLPFMMLGSNYVGGIDILKVFVLGATVYPIVSNYINYAYAEGKYLHVAMIGIVGTIFRLVLYFILGQAMGAIGVAIAYICGIFVSLVPVYISSKALKFTHDGITYLKALLLPSLVSIILIIFQIPWLVGIPTLLFSTIFLYTRFHVINKTDLVEIAQTFLSKESVAKIAIYTSPIIKILFND